MHGGEKISDLKPESFKTAKAIKLQITSSVIFIYEKKILSTRAMEHAGVWGPQMKHLPLQ